MAAPGESFATQQIKLAARIANVDLLFVARGTLQVRETHMPIQLTRSQPLQTAYTRRAIMSTGACDYNSRRSQARQSCSHCSLRQVSHIACFYPCCVTDVFSAIYSGGNQL